MTEAGNALENAHKSQVSQKLVLFSGGQEFFSEGH
jgi:hypothetical protein